MSLPTEHHYHHHHQPQRRRRHRHDDTSNVAPPPPPPPPLSDSEESAELPRRKRARMDLDTDPPPPTPPSSRVGSTEDKGNMEDVKGEESGGRGRAVGGEAALEEMEAEWEFMEERGAEQGGGEGVTPVELQLLPLVKYEYLDHTADVQIHAWGDNLAEAFEQCAMGMFAYITDVERVDNFGSERIEATGHDMLSLLYGFLDEWLFLFNADPYFVARKISITSFDRDNFKISAIGYGETFDLSKHTQGTEVKAITYSNMQFHEKEDYAEVFVIIDI